jgi:hypothetical protein
VANWSFLTSHGKVLLCIAQDPHVRLRDIAIRVAITERRASGIITDLTTAGFLIKLREGRRNSYVIQTHLILPETTGRRQEIGEVLSLLAAPERRTAARPATA